MFFMKGTQHPPPDPPPPGGTLGGWFENTLKKTDIIFGIPNIENPRIDISHFFTVLD